MADGWRSYRIRHQAVGFGDIPRGYNNLRSYRFGDFELDADNRRLSRGGIPIHLERRPMDLLVLLVTQHGQLVTRDAIVSALWPARVIIDFDSGLNTLVRKVRNALEDDPGSPRFIETVAGRGYRFIGELGAPDTAAAVDAPVAAEPTGKSRRAALYIALAGLVILGLVVRELNVEAPEPARIAVLPFENLTGDESLGYLASGLAEETSTSLGQIDVPNLVVIGGVSARVLAESEQPLRQIGDDLNVDYVVTSLLQLDGTKIRVTSRLLRTNDGEQIWSASFDRELTNVLGLQRELSIAIAEQVRQRLSPDVAAAIDRRQTQNAEAYELYLKGRDQWTRFTPDSTDRALQYYRQATRVDPGYALAWAGIAHALATAPITSDAEPSVVVPEARTALERAVQFGPDLAETQYALAVFRLFIDWDFVGASEAAQLAVDLDPNNAIAHMILGVSLQPQDRIVEATAELQRARELDPFFSLIYANAANVALSSRDPQAALELSRQAVANNPGFWVGYFHLGRTYRALGENTVALQAFSDADRLSGGNSKALSSKALLLLTLDRESEARDVLDEMLAQSERRYFPPYALALVYAALGDKELAFDYVERAIAAHDVHLISLPADPRLAILRDDPRFPGLLRRCGCDNRMVEM